MMFVLCHEPQFLLNESEGTDLESGAGGAGALVPVIQHLRLEYLLVGFDLLELTVLLCDHFLGSEIRWRSTWVAVTRLLFPLSLEASSIPIKLPGCLCP
jgi:hypothetical protein